MSRTARVALVASLALAAAACASGKPTGLPTGPTEEPTASAGGTSVGMTDQLSFAPQDLTVKAGATVTWTNTGGVPHTVTSTPDGKLFDAGADPPNLQSGETFKFKFTTAGTFKYFCRLHSPGGTSGMIGTITVT